MDSIRVLSTHIGRRPRTPSALHALSLGLAAGAHLSADLVAGGITITIAVIVFAAILPVTVTVATTGPRTVSASAAPRLGVRLAFPPHRRIEQNLLRP